MRKRTWLGCALTLAALLLSVFPAAAETLDQKYEYARRIKTAQTVGTLGSGLFGDQTNYYNGSTTFTQVDVDLPGNHALPVRVARTWSSAAPEGPTAPGLFGNWELDIPHLHGVFARNYGWQVRTATPNNRCSVPDPFYIEPGAASNKTGTFGGEDYWRGNSLYVTGAGDQSLLYRASGYSKQPADGQSYPWVTTGHWQVRCLPTLASGQPGEGFLAVAPDGTKYTFNWMVSRPYSTIQRAQTVEGPGGGTVYHQLYRDQVRIYPTRVEDRFGNLVTYTYSGEQLTRIEASDGRIITFSYTVEGAIETVTAGGRVWRYEYPGARTGFRGFLTRVVLPDQSAWTFQSPIMVMIYQTQLANNGCDSLGEWDVGPQSLTMTHPSGATGVFTFAPTRHRRSNIPPDQVCRFVDGELEYGPPRESDNYALTGKTLSGPGLPAMQWNISYATGCGSCPTKAATVTNPGQSVTRHTFGTRYYLDEGKLLRTETLSSATGLLLRDESIAYATNPTSPPYAYVVGWNGMTNEDAFGSTRVVPETQRTIAQQGVTFQSTVNGFDSYARPLSIYRASSLGYSKTDTTTYYDHLAKWVLGQTLSSSTEGIETARTDYDGNALPIRNYSFGKLQHMLGYYADGTLVTVTDGNNNTTTLSSWYRGIPQLIRHPATAEAPGGATESASVNDSGWITSVVDENGYATGYGYDAMGRLASIVYPTGDSTVWNTTTLIFEQIGGDELGIAAGHWRQRVTTGNGRKTVLFDALWRPLVEDTHDLTNFNTRSLTYKRYDSNGRLAFQSYPVREARNYDVVSEGMHTSYDALDRVTRVEQDSELGAPTVTTTEYLSGLVTRVTNPRGIQTITEYVAYDQPRYDQPFQIVHPEGAITNIYRNVFGNPTTLRRRNSDYSKYLDRHFIYNSAQELCKRIDAETGATVMGYDAAGNLKWSVTGLDATIACEDGAAYASNGRIDRYYDARNRLTSMQIPGGNGTQDWTYTPDGLPAQSITYNDGGTTAVINRYSYNKRRLLISESQEQPNWYNWPIGYGYDANGNLAAQTYPSGLTVDYAPNALGQPTRAGSYATNVSYYPNGAIAGFTYGNGIVHTLTQNARQLPYRSTDSGGATDLQYHYDANGNVERLYDQRNPADHRYLQYDGLDRLTAAGSQMFGGDHWHRFSYDVLDNLKSWTLGGVKDYAYYDYDANNRLTNIRNSAGASIVGIGYDGQGNVQNKNGQTYSFDYGNRLRSVTNKEHYRYDGHGRRVLAWSPTLGSILSQYSLGGQLLYQHDDRKGKGIEHVYLGGSLVATLDRNWAAGTTVTKYQHTDALGSPVAVTNEGGAVIERTNYEPYGNVIGGTPKDGPGYTGHVLDTATGLNYMQQRYYDPGIGRFLSVDPVTADGNTGGNFNRYKYAANNPYRFVDPDGRQEIARPEVCTGSRLTCGSATEVTFINEPNGGGRGGARRGGGGGGKRSNATVPVPRVQFGNNDLAKHYAEGSGASLSLRQIGLHDDIRNANVTISALSRYGDQIWQRAFNVALENGPGFTWITVGFNRSYDFSSVLWQIGGATLSGNFTAKVMIDGEGRFSYSGIADISFYDRYTDPFDIGDNIPGTWDPTGTPFDITGSWTKQYSGAGP